jgi:hypothetical protein
MENLDLNIENYTKEDLEAFLNLKQAYDIEELNRNIGVIRGKLSSYEDYVKGPVFDFLDKASYYLKSTMNIPDRIGTTTAGSHHNVQYQPVVPAVNTYSYDYPTGKVNPVERSTITKIICIDSLFRENYLNTNANHFVCNLPTPQNNVIELKVVSLELTNMWYMFSTARKNNYFSISLYNIIGQADTTQKVIIPDGNYLSSDFVNVMNNLFINIGNGLQYLTFDISNYTSKCIIRARNLNDTPSSSLYNSSDPDYSPNFYFKVDFNNGESLNRSAGWILGFRRLFYEVKKENVLVDNFNQPSIISYNYYLASESTYGNNIDNYIFLVVEDYNKNFITDAISSTTDFTSYIGNNILGKIPISTNSQTILFNNASDKIFKTRQYLGPVYLKKLQISLVDRFGDYLDIQDTNYSISIELTILY